MSFPINVNIPNAPNDPADDQPLMKDNFSNINGFLSVDHIAPGAANNGKHLQVQMIAEAPPAFLSGFGNIYANTVSGTSQLFFSPDNSGNVYQLTRATGLTYASFGQNVPYGSPPVGFTQTGGWTFLPGGMIFVYGFFGNVSGIGNSGNIQYPYFFTTGTFSVSAIANRSGTGGNGGIVVITSTSTSGFSYANTGSDAKGIFWTAIGV